MLWVLVGLAAACAVAVALRANWNPLPWMGAVMAAGGVFVWGPKTFDAARNAFLHPRMTADQYIKEYFGGHDDPLLGFGAEIIEYASKEPGANHRKYFNRHMGALRRYFVPIDGSEKEPEFNHANPTQLSPWLRLVLLPDLIGLNEGGRQLWRFSPPIEGMDYDWRTSVPRTYFNKPGQKFCFEPLGHAPDIAAWERAYPRIKYLLGGARFTFNYNARFGEVELMTWAEGAPEGKFMGSFPVYAGTAGTAAEIAAAEAGAEPLPYAPLVFQDSQHPHGHLAEGYLYFGEQFLDRSKGGHWMAIADMNHTLVMGTSGFGKSVFLNQLLQGVAFNAKQFDQVVLVDLKGGVELWPYQAQGDRFRVVYRFDDLGPLVAELVATIERRLEVMRKAGQRMWPGGKTLFVVDEYAQIQLSPEATKEERQKKQELLANLNKVSMLGRAAGVLIWAQLQKGTTDVMDSSFRANLSTQVCFKVPNKLTAAGMFGATDELLVDPVKLPKGRFILYDASNGETHYLQARVVR